MKFSSVIFVVGPTAVGKTELAFSLAQRLQGSSMMNCDSVQCYEGLDIGTAKPSKEQRQLIPHFLFDWIQPKLTLTAAQFRRKALLELEQYLKSGPVLAVGGSGFYLRALEKGLYQVQPVPSEISSLWRQKLAQEGAASLHQLLRRKDPEYAAKLHPHDGYRLSRALALMDSEGRSMTSILESQNQHHQTWVYPSFKIGLTLPRQNLRGRVQKRTTNMIQQGLIEEVQSLLQKGLRTWAPMKSVGYKETIDYLDGKILNQQELIERITKSTMLLAKKQMTWFKRDQTIKWFLSDKEGQEAAQRYVMERLLNK